MFVVLVGACNYRQRDIFQSVARTAACPILDCPPPPITLPISLSHPSSLLFVTQEKEYKLEQFIGIVPWNSVTQTNLPTLHNPLKRASLVFRASRRWWPSLTPLMSITFLLLSVRSTSSSLFSTSRVVFCHHGVVKITFLKLWFLGSQKNHKNSDIYSKNILFVRRHVLHDCKSELLNREVLDRVSN